MKSWVVYGTANDDDCIIRLSKREVKGGFCAGRERAARRVKVRRWSLSTFHAVFDVLLSPACPLQPRTVSRFLLFCGARLSRKQVGTMPLRNHVVRPIVDRLFSFQAGIRRVTVT